MAFTFPTTLTGLPVTGLTSPTYTLALDQNVGDERLAIVSALGGTQAGVAPHSLSAPFLIKAKRPKQLKQLRAVSGDRLVTPPRNEWSLQCVKGVNYLAGQPSAPLLLELRAVVPAGAETVDATSVAASISAFLAWINANPQALYDVIRSNQL